MEHSSHYPLLFSSGIGLHCHAWKWIPFRHSTTKKIAPRPCIFDTIYLVGYFLQTLQYLLQDGSAFTFRLASTLPGSTFGMQQLTRLDDGDFKVSSCSWILLGCVMWDKRREKNKVRMCVRYSFGCNTGTGSILQTVYSFVRTNNGYHGLLRIVQIGKQILLQRVIVASIASSATVLNVYSHSWQRQRRRHYYSVLRSLQLEMVCDDGGSWKRLLLLMLVGRGVWFDFFFLRWLPSLEESAGMARAYNPSALCILRLPFHQNGITD